MKYFDLHCDALSAAGKRQVTGERLRRGNCGVQCFAVFVSAREKIWERALAQLDNFSALCREEGIEPLPKGGLPPAEGEGVCAVLTAEGGEILEGDLDRVDLLAVRGVRALGLTWNYPNALGFPSFPDYEGLCRGHGTPVAREERRGLTKLGFEAVEKLNACGILADVSHGSDALVRDVASFRRPFLASHSCANEVFPHARNLTDEDIRLIADSGGVVGLCFAEDFLTRDRTPEGLREAVLRHAAHILRVGGENALALGSDFDGTAPNRYLPGPSHLSRLFADLEKKFGARIAEKIFFSNAARLFGIL